MTKTNVELVKEITDEAEELITTLMNINEH